MSQPANLSAPYVPKPDVVQPQNVSGLKVRKNGNITGIVLTTLSSLAVLGGAGLIIFTALKMSPSSVAFKGMLSGGIVVVVISAAGIGKGVHFIKKSYWEDPRVLQELRDKVTENLDDYTFERLMSEFPRDQLIHIISEKNLADKFIKYLKGYIPLQSYISIVNNFYSNNVPDENFNPWGYKFNETFVPKQLLKEILIQEINNTCKENEVVSPKKIGERFINDNPIKNGMLSWNTWEKEFTDAASTYKYSDLKEYLVGIVPDEIIRKGLMAQFKNSSSVVEFLRSHSTPNSPWQKMFVDGVITDISSTERKKVDPKREQLFLSDLREVAAIEDPHRNGYHQLGSEFNTYFPVAYYNYIKTLKTLEKSDLVLTRSIINDAHSCLVERNPNSITKDYMGQISEALKKAFLQHVQKNGFNNVYREIGNIFVWNLLWDISKYSSRVTKAEESYETLVLSAKQEQSKAILAAEEAKNASIKEYVDAVRDLEVAIQDIEYKYPTGEQVTKSCDAAKTIYKSKTASNPFANVIFTNSVSKEKLLEKNEQIKIWKLSILIWLDEHKDFSGFKDMYDEKIKELAQILQIGSEPNNIPARAAAAQRKRQAEEIYTATINHNSGRETLVQAIARVNSEYDKDNKNVNDAFVAKAEYEAEIEKIRITLSSNEEEKNGKLKPLAEKLRSARTLLKEKSVEPEKVLEAAKQAANATKDAKIKEAENVNLQELKKIDADFKEEFLKPVASA